MGEAGDKPTPKPRRLDFGHRRSAADIDSGNVTLIAEPGSYAVTGAAAEMVVIDTATWQWRQRLEQRLERRLLEALERRVAADKGKSQARKQRRKQVKRVQEP